MTDRTKALHPSEYVREEIEERRWDRDILAWMMVLECSNVRDALRKIGTLTPEAYKALGEQWQLERVALDFFFDVGPTEPAMRMGDMAQRFSKAFGCSDQLFTNLENAWLAEDSRG